MAYKIPMFKHPTPRYFLDSVIGREGSIIKMVREFMIEQSQRVGVPKIFAHLKSRNPGISKEEITHALQRLVAAGEVEEKQNHFKAQLTPADYAKYGAPTRHVDTYYRTYYHFESRFWAYRQARYKKARERTKARLAKSNPKPTTKDKIKRGLEAIKALRTPAPDFPDWML